MSEEVRTKESVTTQPDTSVVLTPPVAVTVSEEASTVAVVDKTGSDIIVFGKSPDAILSAQINLVEWAVNKVGEEEKDLDDLEENLRIAKERKWRTDPWKRRVAIAKKRVIYYRKMLDAFKAGYVLMPNVQYDLFAVRTSKNAPLGKEKKGTRYSPVESDSSITGEGRYVDQMPFYEVTSEKDRIVNDGSSHQYVVTDVKSVATAFDETIDFPLSFAKPRVLDATGKAMVRKIFDEIGVLPRTRKGDPMVIGRIKGHFGSVTKEASFLICWYIDTKEL